ncbi:hypothetical protein BC629DRAFT_1524502, partial [Irpex lacteus]
MALKRCITKAVALLTFSWPLIGSRKVLKGSGLLLYWTFVGRNFRTAMGTPFDPNMIRRYHAEKHAFIDQLWI